MWIDAYASADSAPASARLITVSAARTPVTREGEAPRIAARLEATIEASL
jgi:hypothetical protein